MVDPRRTELAAHADIHLAIRPGEDPTLLATFLNIVLTDQLFDAAFCDQWVGDLEALSNAVTPFTPLYAAQRCDVAADDIVAAAHLFAAAFAPLVGGCDVIVPIPSDRERLRARGFSPALWLATALGRGTPVAGRAGNR